MPAHYDAWRHAFKVNNASFDFTWELFYSMAGMGHHDSVLMLNARFGDRLDPEAVLEAQHARLETVYHTIGPIQPVVDFAREVAQTHPVAVASGGRRPQVLEALRLAGLENFFEIIVTKEDVTRSKPAPDSFLLAAERLGVSPLGCVVLEDSKLGLQAAEAAGMHPVYIDPAIFSKLPDKALA